MSVLRPSLLQRLQQTGEQAAWARLVDLYSAHLFLWACRAGLQGAEAAELVRGVFTAVAQKLSAFRTDSPGGFRAWLRSMAHTQRSELIRKRAPAPASEASPVPAGADALWGTEYLPAILGSAVDLLQAEFAPVDWKACWGVTVEGRAPVEVARELGITPAAVHAAEARVLRRLRQELSGLLYEGPAGK